MENDLNTSGVPFNVEVAAKLDEIADILRIQGANPFRVRAYENGADVIRHTSISLELIVRNDGIAGLEALPAIGSTLARLIFQIVATGRIPMLDRLRSGVDPVSTLATVPGIGRKSANLLHESLGINSLEELEVAAYDGRLAEVGFGPKRIAGIRDSLSTRLGRLPRQSSLAASEQPPVSEILDVDCEYREKAAAGTLHKVAPRRFNPQRRAWLPILHTSRDSHHYTALYSNTARAHEAAKTAEWVVIYFETDHKQRQYTVVDSKWGPLLGKRVVKGREQECLGYYGENGAAADLNYERSESCSASKAASIS